MTNEAAGEELALAILTRTNPRERDFERGMFEKIMREHERMVINTAYRLIGRMEDARDAAQEVFLRLLKNLDRIEGDPKPWLYRVTVNVCHDHFRRRMPVKEPDATQADPGADFSGALELEDRKRILMQGLETLPPRERAAIVLRDIEGLSTRETAVALGIEEATVRSLISVGRVKLAKFVRERK